MLLMAPATTVLEKWQSRLAPRLKKRRLSKVSLAAFVAITSPSAAEFLLLASSVVSICRRFFVHQLTTLSFTL
jgi:hypothetical protein